MSAAVSKEISPLRVYAASLVICISFMRGSLAMAQQDGHADLWLTSRDRVQLLARQQVISSVQDAASQSVHIEIDDSKTYQAVDGFGFAMTGGSALLLHRMDPIARHALLQEIFGHGPHDIGVSFLRVSIGSSDMDDHVFTFDDMPAGQTDASLAHFSLAGDMADLVPIMQEVLRISPGLQILASPWTAPFWMKTNGLPKSGRLRPEFYSAYAAYLVRYLEAMKSNGIPIAALTMQNEPLNPKNTPSMVMEAPEENVFLRDALGPALEKAGLPTRVILFDHNCDHPDYPIAILSDPKTRQYADGSGFHLYAGKISALSQVHDAFPDKNLYFTEQMVVEQTRDGVLEPVANPISRIVIGAMRNWSRIVLLWNLAADVNFGPHTSDGGCPVCQGAITLDGNSVTRNIAFYTIAHVSRFVPPGSVRIDSTQSDPDLANVAWRTPQGRHVLLVTNTGTAKKIFTIDAGAEHFSSAFDPGTAGTFMW